MVHRRSGRVILLAAAILLIAGLIFSVRGSGSERGRVIIGGASVSVEIERTRTDRERGLSGRAELAPDQGMLFVFPEAGSQTFWMKDMRFPIDIIWLRRNEIVFIAPDVPPPAPGEAPATRTPTREADAVLEVPAGFAAAHGLKPGMSVEMALDGR